MMNIKLCYINVNSCQLSRLNEAKLNTAVPRSFTWVRETDLKVLSTTAPLRK